MPVNLLANPEHYRVNKRDLNTESDVIEIVKEFLRSNVNGDEEHFDTMFGDMSKEYNREIRFDESNEEVTRHGNEGERVAYGAFRHSALEHGTQTVWTYTFEIIETDNNLYLGTDSWGWLHDADLEDRVTRLVE